MLPLGGHFYSAGDTAEDLFNEQEPEDDTEEYINLCVYHFLAYVRGQQSESLGKLEELANDAPTREQKEGATSWLLIAYIRSGHNEKAITRIGDELDSTNEEKWIVELANKLSEAHLQQGDKEAARSGFRSALSKVLGTEMRSELFRAIGNFEKEQENVEAAALSYSMASKLNPGDSSLLFDCAYHQSAAGWDLAALQSYNAIRKMQPNNSSALNNLGVSAGELKLQIKSNKFYSRAMLLGNSLASANFANSLIEIGMIESAKEILDEALKSDDVHENVNSAVVRVNELTSEEDKKWGQILEEARSCGSRLIEYATAYFDTSGTSSCFAGSWRTKKGAVLDVSVNESYLIGSGSELRPPGGLSLLSGEHKPQEHTLLLEGTISGSSARVSYTEVLVDGAGTVVTDHPYKVECFSLLRDDGKKWLIYGADRGDSFELELEKIE